MKKLPLKEKLRQLLQISLVLLLFATPSLAQENVKKVESTSVGGLSIGLHAGFNALHSIGSNYKPQFGFDVAYQLNESFTIRGGYGDYSVNVPEWYTVFDGISTKLDIDLKGKHTVLLADWQFMKKYDFRLTAGAGYFLKPELTASFALTRSIAFNDIEVTPGEIGYVDIMVTSNKLNPYIGIGYGDLVAKGQNFSFTVDLGTFYMTKKEVDLKATNFLKNNINNEPKIQENINSFSSWIPIVSVRLGYRLE